VAVRNLGYQSSAHFFTFTEYALLVVPCLGAPWLVREKGHVYVEILLMALSDRQRAVLRYLIGALCIAALPSGTDSRQLFNQLLAWGMSMVVVGTGVCWLLF